MTFPAALQNLRIAKPMPEFSDRVAAVPRVLPIAKPTTESGGVIGAGARIG
mgnify:CR=1 FL=1